MKSQEELREAIKVNGRSVEFRSKTSDDYGFIVFKSSDKYYINYEDFTPYTYPEEEYDTIDDLLTNLDIEYSEYEITT